MITGSDLALANPDALAGQHELLLYMGQVIKQQIASNPFIPHTPTPKQALFCALPNLEVLYGGALAGGKSDALLMAAVMYVDRPNYRALIIRRTLAELTMPGALIQRSKEWWLGTGAKYNANEHSWTFPSGAQIWFGYLKSSRDVERYASSEWDFIGIDELVSIREQDYTLLFGRIRKNKSEIDLVDVPPRMRAASNPPTEDQEELGWWVKVRLYDQGWPYFIPAFIDDNPHIEEGYLERLATLYDPVTFLKLVKGDWTVRAQGGMFKRNWFEIVNAIPQTGWLSMVRGWDKAATKPHAQNKDPDWTRGVMCMRHSSGEFYFTDMQSLRDEAPEVAQFIQSVTYLDPYEAEVAIEQEPSGDGKAVAAMYTQLLAGRKIEMVPASRDKGSKISRATPLAIQAKAQNVKLLRGEWNNDFINELVSQPKGRHDDIMDAAAIAFNRCALMGPLMATQSGMAQAFLHRGARQ